MRYPPKVSAWVVYRMTLRGVPAGLAAVCEQREWDAMEAAQPGLHALIRAGIASEGEAEQLARAVAIPATPPAK
jgi:hypothetical protein